MVDGFETLGNAQIDIGKDAFRRRRELPVEVRPAEVRPGEVRPAEVRRASLRSAPLRFASA